MNGNSDYYDSEAPYLRYNRSDRLKRASPSVQRMHEPDYIVKPGLLKALTATRASRSILFSIVIICILIGASEFVQREKKTGIIDGIPVKLEALIQEHNLYINAVFAETEKSDTYMLPITVHITARHTGTGEAETKTMNAVYIGSALRLPVQFPSNRFTEIEAVITAENKTLHLRKSLETEP